MKLPKIPKPPSMGAKLSVWEAYHEHLGRYLKVWAQVENLGSRIQTPRTEHAETVRGNRKLDPKYRKRLKNLGLR